MELVEVAVVAIIVAWLLVHGVSEIEPATTPFSVLRAIIYFSAAFLVIGFWFTAS